MSDYFGRVRSAIRTSLGRLSGAVKVKFRRLQEVTSRPTTLRGFAGSVRKTGENLILAALGVGLFLSQSSWQLIMGIGLGGVLLAISGSIMEGANDTDTSGGDS